MSQIIPAASVLLCGGPDQSQVFLVQRGEHLRFFGGFWAFPGGKLAPEDHAIPLQTQSQIAPPDLHPLVVAVARELFEETGVLVARTASGALCPPLPELDLLRQELMAERLSFASILEQLGLTLWSDDFRPIGRITTPPFVTMRFATTFFVAHLPPGQQAVIWPGELTAGLWLSARETLARWVRGELLLSPPTALSLQIIGDGTPDEAPTRLGPLFQRLEAGGIHPIFFAPQVQLIPLQTPSLPPTNHTNAYLVGHDPAYLVDPGPSDPLEQQRLFDLLDERIAAGVRLRALVLTHQHIDHIGAAQVCRERYQIPVLAHPLTAERLEGKVTVGHLLNHGDQLDLGTRPDGSGSWQLEAIHTPGHAAGHLCFWEPYYRLLLIGDMASTLTSIVIVPPEGDLSQYLDSLQRLLKYDARLLLPAHGGASSRPQQMLTECLAHRAKREHQLLTALGSAPRPIGELTPELYKGVPAQVLPLAERQLLAGLLKLQREGKVEEVEQGWRLRTDGETG